LFTRLVCGRRPTQEQGYRFKVWKLKNAGAVFKNFRDTFRNITKVQKRSSLVPGLEGDLKMHVHKSLFLMRTAPPSMTTDQWYEAIYNQWHQRESWCSMYDRPMLSQLTNRRHFPYEIIIIIQSKLMWHGHVACGMRSRDDTMIRKYLWSINGRIYLASPSF
jgi:hypothetical protein